MNKRAFTLVELLAVIVILSILALLTGVAVTKMVKDSKESLSNTQIKLIESSVETWAIDNLNKLPSSGTCSYMTLQDLYDYGILESDIIDSKTNEKLDTNLKIKISAVGDPNKPIINYETNPNSVDGCTRIYAVRQCGDVNDDGRVDTTDRKLINQHYLGNYIIAEEDFKYADLNGDGRITTIDAAILGQYISGFGDSRQCNLD